MNHKQKVRLARRMLAPDEIRAGTPIFQSRAWYARVLKNIKKQEAQSKNQKTFAESLAR